MVKSLPSFETIISVTNNPSGEVKTYLKELDKNKKYKTKTLKKAYKIDRQNLENISEIEQAYNYSKSDFKFMALYCFLVSLFLDLSPLFVGIFIYFTNNKKNNKNESE